jgi:hypothetical protein
LISLIVVTPIHPASYTTLMTIIAADVRTPIVTVPPIPIIPIRTMGIAVVTIWAIVPIVPIAMAVVAVPAAIISTAIYTPIMSAVDAIVGLRLFHRQ